jgi:hypothetical protein
MTPTPRRSSSAAKPAVGKRNGKRGGSRAASLSVLFEGTGPAKSAGLPIVAPEKSSNGPQPAPTLVSPPHEPKEEAPATTAATTNPAASPLPAAPPARPPATTEAMIAYWNRLRQGRRYPALSDIDASYLVDGWPGAILFECAGRGADRPGQSGGVLRMSRLGTGTGDVAYTPMVMEWMLSLAREAAQTGEAIEDRDNFPAAGSVARYRLVLLPLGEAQQSVGHVLGALERI